MASIRRSSPLASTSFSVPSALALPASIRKNSSFARLATLVGFGKWSGKAPEQSNDEDDDEEEDGEGELSSGSDETPVAEEAEHGSHLGAEALLWDAKAALTANHPLLAVEHYTTAALPPYRSAQACLALGTILLKDASAFGSLTPPMLSRKGKEKEILPLPSAIPLGGSGVRDVETMGIAAGWLVLGIAWVIQSHVAKRSSTDGEVQPEEQSFVGELDEEEPMIIPRKHHTHHTHHTHHFHRTHHTATEDFPVELLGSLLEPLLQLYRGNRIRADDPVALPPITSLQLPEVLKPQGDASRGRNAWYQGRIVAEKLLSLESPRSSAAGDGGDWSSVLVMANFILGLTSPYTDAAKYWKQVVDKATSQELIDEASKRLEKCILDSPGLVLKSKRQHIAASKYPKRIITGLPSGLPSRLPERATTSPLATSRAGHHRDISISSFNSAASGASKLRIVSFNIKPSPSSASLTLDSDTTSVFSLSAHQSTDSGSALDTLRRIQAQIFADEYDEEDAHKAHSDASSAPSSPRSSAANPSTAATSLEPSPRGSDPPLPRSKILETNRRLEIPTIRTIASSPQLPTLTLDDPPPNLTSSASTPRRKLPFEPSKDQRILGVDPALAAAELSSALTKHVQCGVCGAKGVNFPNCRKCGLTFCSRICRVDVNKAGNGLKHVCGAWESRKLLSVPPVSPNGRLEKERATRAPVVLH